MNQERPERRPLWNPRSLNAIARTAAPSGMHASNESNSQTNQKDSENQMKCLESIENGDSRHLRIPKWKKRGFWYILLHGSAVPDPLAAINSQNALIRFGYSFLICCNTKIVCNSLA